MTDAITHDAAIARIAARRHQHGNVTRAQLHELGLRDGAIKHRLHSGRLHKVHPGVYGVGRPPKTALERAAAAVLACGPEAALSHIPALALWGFGATEWPWRMEVTLPGDRDRRPAGITVHRSKTLTRRDVRTHQGIRVTSPARTLLDCAPRLDEPSRARAVNDALRSKHLSEAQLEAIVHRSPHHPGTKLLTPFLSRPGAPTRSELEDKFLAFCERFNLPTPITNTTVAGHEADAYFPAEKLIVELDSWSYHSDRATFESDRNRDADSLLAGLGTVRITEERLTGSKAADEAARLRAILEARRAAAS